MTICPVPRAAALHTRRLLKHSPHSSAAHCSLFLSFCNGGERAETLGPHARCSTWSQAAGYRMRTQQPRWKSEAFKIKRRATKCSASRGQNSGGCRSWTSREMASQGQSLDPARGDSLALRRKTPSGMRDSTWFDPPEASTHLSPSGQDSKPLKKGKNVSLPP